MRRTVSVVLVIGAIGVGSSVLRTEAETLTLWVAPYWTDCVGIPDRKCLLVSSDPAEEWEYLFDGIDGFAFEPGFTWKLMVRRFPLPDSPGDGSTYRLVLIEVLEKRTT